MVLRWLILVMYCLSAVAVPYAQAHQSGAMESCMDHFCCCGPKLRAAKKCCCFPKVSKADGRVSLKSCQSPITETVNQTLRIEIPLSGIVLIQSVRAEYQRPDGSFTLPTPDPDRSTPPPNPLS